MTTAPIPEGFTPFDGNECPCPGQPADVMFRDGHVSRACVQMPKADGWHWGRTRHPKGEISAYRVVEKTW